MDRYLREMMRKVYATVHAELDDLDRDGKVGGVGGGIGGGATAGPGAGAGAGADLWGPVAVDCRAAFAPPPTTPAAIVTAASGTPR